MEKLVRVFNSFEEAEPAERAYDRSLTPEQRMRILFELVEDHDGGDAPEVGFQKVYRIVELGQPKDPVDVDTLDTNSPDRSR